MSKHWTCPCALTFFLRFTKIVVCSLTYICLYILEAYTCIANNMDPDQTAPMGAV